MANSGIKLSAQALAAAEAMHDCKDIKGIFLCFSADRKNIVPDVCCGNDKDIPVEKAEHFKYIKDKNEVNTYKSLIGDAEFRHTMSCSFYEGDIVEEMKNRFKDDKAGYGVFRVPYRVKDGSTDRANESLAFVMWGPDGSDVKSKMLISSTKDACKRGLGAKLPSMSQTIEINERGDICPDEILNKCHKGSGTVTELDGRPLEVTKGKHYQYKQCRD